VAVPPPKRSSRQTLLGLAVLAVIIVAIVGGLLFFRDRLPAGATDLGVGDCIDLPAAEGDFTDVQHQPCNEAHDAEVILVLTHPAPAGEAYPVISGFDDYIEDNCVPAFRTYTGREYATDTEYELGYFHPTLSGWGEGDRGFTCHVYRVDRAKMSSSIRSGAPTGT
jgi:hypothetical protein